MATDELKTGGLFVDFENVFYGLVGEPLSLTRDAALSATMDVLTKLRQQLREQGYALVVERSYSDWEKMPESAQRQLQISGVLPRFVDARIDKNTADIELSLDVLHHILTRRELKHLVLVGGDRDYLPILRRLKEEQRHVIVCALKKSLSGDIREFVGQYVGASIIELDSLVDFGQYPRQDRQTVATNAAPRTTGNGTHAPLAAPFPAPPPRPPPPPLRFDPSASYDIHEAYLRAMQRFMQAHKYKELHLGPFFRWLTTSNIFPTESSTRLRQIFDELQRLGAVRIEQRDTGQGYGFSVASLEYNHPLVQRSNDG